MTSEGAGSTLHRGKKSRLLTFTSEMPRLTSWYEFLKSLMMLLSAIILFSGLVLVCLGIWIKYGAVNFIQLMGFFSRHLLITSYMCMGVGGALCLLGMIGCCGAWKQNRCLMLLYYLILFMMFTGQIVGTTVVILYKDLMTSMIHEAGKDSLMTAYMGPAATDPISRAWNSIMTEYKCCGFKNSTQDFKGSIFQTNTGLLYPKTCCVDMNSAACDGLDTTSGLIYQQSCMGKLTEVIKDKSVIITAVAASVCILELASMMISLVLYMRL